MKWIGIDPGTHTGLAVWDSFRQELVEVSTLKLHQALDRVLYYAVDREPVQVVFEDARLRRWFGSAGREQLQGAGSIKRDCQIWEDFLSDHCIKFQSVAPARGATKWTPAQFALATGYKGRTSNHARDAALLVVGRGNR